MGAGGEPRQRRANLLGGKSGPNAAEDTEDRNFLFFIMPRKSDAASVDEGELKV